MMSTIITERVG